MQYKIFFACFLYGMIFATQAQIFFGGQSGVALSKATVDTRNIEFTATEYMPGLRLGANAEVNINQYLQMAFEPNYTQKGYNIRKYLNADYQNRNDTRNSDLWTFQMHYLEMPLSVRYFLEGEKFKAFAGVGVYSAYWVAGTLKGIYITADLGGTALEQKRASSPYEFDKTFGANNRKDNRWDVGWLASAGISYKLQKGQININSYYVQGLADRVRFNASPPINHTAVWNQNWAVTLGYSIAVSHKKLFKIKKSNLEEETDTEEQQDD